MVEIMLVFLGKSIIDRVGQTDIIPSRVTCYPGFLGGANVLMLKGILLFPASRLDYYS